MTIYFRQFVHRHRLYRTPKNLSIVRCGWKCNITTLKGPHWLQADWFTNEKKFVQRNFPHIHTCITHAHAFTQSNIHIQNVQIRGVEILANEMVAKTCLLQCDIKYTLNHWLEWTKRIFRSSLSSKAKINILQINLCSSVVSIDNKVHFIDYMIKSQYEYQSK